MTHTLTNRAHPGPWLIPLKSLFFPSSFVSLSYHAFASLPAAAGLAVYSWKIAFEKKQSHMPLSFSKFLESKRLAGGNTAMISSPVHGDVQSRSTQSVYVVDLEQKPCSCGIFQENGIPCQHALRCIYRIHASPKDSLPELLFIATWKNTYIENWGPISLDNVSPTDSTCFAPIKQRALVGRPQTTRMETGHQKQKKTRQHQDTDSLSSSPLWHCKKCGTVWHNSRSRKAWRKVFIISIIKHISY